MISMAGCTGGSASVDSLGVPVPEATDPFGANGNSALLFSPISTDFGVQRVLTSSAPQTLLLTNVARAALYISTVGNQSNPHFSVVSHDCPISPTPLGAGESCNVRVRFTPQTTGILQTALTTIFGRSPEGTEYQAFNPLRGIGATSVTFGGITSIDRIRAASVRLNWTDVPGENGFFIFMLDPVTSLLQYIGSAPPLATSFVVPNLTGATAYRFRVQAVDFFGNIDSNTVNASVTTTPTPVLTAQPSRLMTSSAGELIFGNTYSFDFNDVSQGGAGNDINMSYSCYFDNLIDGAVTATLPCSGIPGLTLDAGFATNGLFSWTPPASGLSKKTFEILVRGNDGSIDADRIFGVNIRDPYIRANTLWSIAAEFASGGNPGVNAPISTPRFANLIYAGASLDGTLAGSFATGWQGTGTNVLDPYRLVFDGISGATASRVTTSQPLGVTGTFAFSTWLKPTNTSLGADAYVLSNGGRTGVGWSLRQNPEGSLQLDLGLTVSYETAILAQNPTAFYKLEELSGTTITDSSGHGNIGTISNIGSVIFGGTGHDGTSIRFAGNSNFSVGPFYFPGGAYSVSAWVKTPLPADGAWKTVTRGVSGDHQIIFNQSTNEFGSYFGGMGGFTGSGVFVNSLSAGWHLFTIVGTASSTSYYVDGNPTPSPITANHSVADIGYIANYQGGGQPAYDVDGVAIWLRSLSPAEVNAQFSGSFGCQAPLTQNYWQNISGIFDGTKISLFRNGTQVCSITPPVAPTPANPQPVSLGAKLDGSNAWPGQLSDLKVYSTLSSGDVTTNFNSSYNRYFDIPASIAGLQVWMDAKDPNSDGVLPADGSAISVWKDKSGNGYDMTTSGNTPLLATSGLDAGHPAIHYDGNGSHKGNYLINGEYTLVYVSRLNGNQNARVLGDWTGQNLVLGYWSGKMHGFYINGTPENLFSNTTPLAITATTQKNAYAFTRQGAGGAFSFYSQGALYAANSGASNAAPFKLVSGCGNGVLGECSNVFVSEIIVYNRVLTTAEMDSLYTYLKNRWGF